MKRLALCLTIALAACGPGDGPPRHSGPPPEAEGAFPERPRPGRANPSAVIATELAFARLAQDKGQWTAFRERAAPGAELFVPQRVDALTWLKDRADPPIAVKWQARSVWTSCDGSTAVTTGEWQRPGASGTYATVWRRQPEGDYRWLLDMSLSSAGENEAFEMISAQVADCDGAPLAVTPDIALEAGQDAKVQVSRDGSLRWTSAAKPDGTRRFILTVRREGKDARVLDLSAATGTP